MSGRFRRKTQLLAVLLVAGLAFVGAGCSKPVASVNGEAISRSDFDKRLEAKAGRQVLEELINEKLIKQEAKKQKVSVPRKEVNARLVELKDRFPSEADFMKNLEENGINVAEAKRQIENQLMLQKMLESTSPADGNPGQAQSTAQGFVEELRKKAKIKTY